MNQTDETGDEVIDVKMSMISATVPSMTHASGRCASVLRASVQRDWPLSVELGATAYPVTHGVRPRPESGLLIKRRAGARLLGDALTFTPFTGSVPSVLTG